MLRPMKAIVCTERPIFEIVRVYSGGKSLISKKREGKAPFSTVAKPLQRADILHKFSQEKKEHEPDLFASKERAG